MESDKERYLRFARELRERAERASPPLRDALLSAAANMEAAANPDAHRAEIIPARF